MKITEEIYKKFEHLFPQRHKARISNIEILNMFLNILEKGEKWSTLGENWHSIYIRVNRWEKRGILRQIFSYLEKEGIISIKKKISYLDSECIVFNSEFKN